MNPIRELTNAIGDGIDLAINGTILILVLAVFVIVIGAATHLLA